MLTKINLLVILSVILSLTTLKVDVRTDSNPVKNSLSSCMNLNNTNLDGSMRSCETGGEPDRCCSYWTNTYSEETQFVGGIWPRSYPVFSCSTGGEDQCVLGRCSQVAESL